VDGDVDLVAGLSDSNWSVDSDVDLVAGLSDSNWSVDSDVDLVAGLSDSNWSVDGDVDLVASASNWSSSARTSSCASLEDSWLVDSGQVEGFHLTVNGNGHNDARDSNDSY
jgi:hypothetical protein